MSINYCKVAAKAVIYKTISLVAFIEISILFNYTFQLEDSENKQAFFFPSQPSSWTSSILPRDPN